MEAFFQTYGPLIVYVAIFLGSLVEGESVVLLCSALAYKYSEISLPILIGLAFFGSMSADQTLFFVGRIYGPRIIERRESWKEASKRVFYHLHRHSTLFIFSFRFIYGIRTISPIVIGAAGVAVKRFAILNFFSALFWATISCLGGYLLGYFFADRIEDFIVNIEHYQKYIAIFIISVVCLIAVYAYWKTHRSGDKKDHNEVE